MRISDWSSDVCSSDLLPGQREHVRRQPRAEQRLRLDLLCGGMGFGLHQDGFEAAEHLLKHGDGCGVDRKAHAVLLRCWQWWEAHGTAAIIAVPLLSNDWACRCHPLDINA